MKKINYLLLSLALGMFLPTPAYANKHYFLYGIAGSILFTCYNGAMADLTTQQLNRARAQCIFLARQNTSDRTELLEETSALHKKINHYEQRAFIGLCASIIATLYLFHECITSLW